MTIRIKKIKLDSTNISAIICVILLFLSSWAALINDSPLGTDGMRRVGHYLLWLLALLSFFMSFNRKTIRCFEIIAILSVLIYRACNVLYAYDYKGLGITNIFICVCICVQSEETKNLIFKYFKYLMVISGAIAVICFISYYTPFALPHIVIPRGDGVEWYDYKFCYLMNQHNTLIRLNGFFDEPGWFGTWAAFYLCADRLNFKKFDNIILLIAGFLTFSLAFVMLLLIYYVLINLTDWKKWVWLVVFAGLYLFVIPNIKTGNNSIDTMISRMVITSNGLVGNNRYGDAFGNLYEHTIHSSKVWFGYGAGYTEIFGAQEGVGIASIKSYIVNFGIIGTIVIYVPIFSASVIRAIKTKNKAMMFYIIITFASLYQRPYLFNIPYFIIFICGLSYTAVLKIEEEQNCSINMKMAFNRRYNAEILNSNSNLQQ